MSELCASENFVRPTPQDALGGEAGLAAEDIARSLGVDLKVVLKKLRRDEWRKSSTWVALPVRRHHQANGGEFVSYVLNVRAAKGFVLRWANELSDSYANFLFDCEDAVLNRMPRLISELRTLRASVGDYERQIEAFKRPKTRSIKGKGVVKYTPYLEKIVTLFTEDGPDYVRMTRKQVVAEMTKSEHNTYAAQHISKINRGNSKRLRRILKEENCQAAGLLEAAEKLAEASELLYQGLNRPELPEVDIDGIRSLISLRSQGLA